MHISPTVDFSSFTYRTPSFSKLFEYPLKDCSISENEIIFFFTKTFAVLNLSVSNAYEIRLSVSFPGEDGTRGKGQFSFRQRKAERV